MKPDPRAFGTFIHESQRFSAIVHVALVGMEKDSTMPKVKAECTLIDKREVKRV